MDVALLAVEALRTFPSEGFEAAESDALRPLQRVRCVGFALGSTVPQSSAGVVSARVALPNRIQIDLAVNGGNSGGPLIDAENRVVGIITSGINGAQNINYAAPMHESMAVLRRVASRGAVGRPHYEMGVDFNCHFAKLNQTLVDALPGISGGVFVTHANKLLDPRSSLRAGDVLHALELPGSGGAPRALDVQMRVDAPWWSGSRLMFHTVLDRLQIEPGGTSERLVAHVLRDADGSGTLADVRVELKLRSPLHAFRDLYEFVEPIRYVCRAGVVVQVDNDTLSGSRWAHARRLCKYINFAEMDMYSTLIVTHIAADSPYMGCDLIAADDHVVAVNNTAVATLEEFAEAFQNSPGDLVTLRMRDGSMATATRAQIEACEASAKHKRRTTAPAAVGAVHFHDAG